MQDVLAKVSLFADLTSAELEVVTVHAITRTFPKHSIILNEGEQSHNLYVILDGRVKVYASDDDGKEILLNELGPGDYFGELALVDEEPRSASVSALENTKLTIIAQQDFLTCLERMPSIAINLVKVLARKLRQQTRSTKILALNNVYERVAKTLYDLASEKEGKLVVSGQTHRTLADRVGASREMVSLVLKELKEGGYIKVTRGSITLSRKLPERW